MMKRMIFCAVLLMVCMACSRQAEQQPADPELRFNNNGKFKIAQFTDTHLGYDRKEVFDAAVKMMKNIIEQEKPDLVMLTGDIVTGNQMKEADEHGSFTIDDFTFRDTDWHRGLKRVYLEEGYHPIKIKLFTKDYHVLKLQWRPQEVDRLTEIPKANFFVE